MGEDTYFCDKDKDKAGELTVWSLQRQAVTSHLSDPIIPHWTAREEKRRTGGRKARKKRRGGAEKRRDFGLRETTITVTQRRRREDAREQAEC